MKNKIETEIPDRWLTAAEVAKLIGFSKSQIWEGQGALGELTPIRGITKRSVRYSQREVLEWMAAQLEKAKEQRSVPAKSTNVVELRPRKRPRNFERERANRIIAFHRNRRSNND